MSLRGLTHLTTFLIRFPFGVSSIQNLPNSRSTGDLPKEHNVLETVGHEGMHFYQGVTTNFVFDLSRKYFDATTSALKKIAARATPIRAGAFTELSPHFEKLVQSVWQEHAGIRPIDLMEGAAVHATYRALAGRTLPDYFDGPRGFEVYLQDRFDDPSRDHYVRAYLSARRVLGDVAYFLFGKISYLALCTQEPAEAFSNCIAVLRGKCSRDLTELSVSALGKVLGIQVENCLPLIARANLRGVIPREGWPPYNRWFEDPKLATGTIEHPILGPYLAFLAEAPDKLDVLSFAAEPLRDALIRSASQPSTDSSVTSFLEDFVPPMHCYDDGRGNLMGLGKKLGPDYAQAVIHYTAMIGLVQRLTSKDDVEMFCPHQPCPYHSTGLCWRYYAFPSREFHKCSFPERAKELLGREIDIAQPEKTAPPAEPDMDESPLNSPFEENHADLSEPLLPDAIRELQIEESDLLSCNVATFERLFSPMTLPSSMAKQMRGSVVLSSAWCDRDPRPNWQIPEWRAFVEQLFKELPHFSYFMLAVEQFYVGVVLSLLPIAEASVAVEGRAVNCDRVTLIAKLKSLLEPVLEYCKIISDDARLALRNLLQGFSPDVAHEVLEKLRLS